MNVVIIVLKEFPRGGIYFTIHYVFASPKESLRVWTLKNKKSVSVSVHISLELSLIPISTVYYLSKIKKEFVELLHLLCIFSYLLIMS